MVFRLKFDVISSYIIFEILELGMNYELKGQD